MKTYFRVLGVIAGLLWTVVIEAQSGVISPTENLVVEGIPEIPADLAESVRRYTESRGAAFVDWHPQRREMLISTRFGNTSQIHEVRMPGGARRQLTFFSEPVGVATWEPVQGRYFVFSRDTGGNEFSQLYRWDAETGEVTLLTDGGRSQNGGLVWNHAGTQFCYATTRRNGADRDLWIMDPLKPADSHAIVQLQGGGWSALDWSPDDSTLVARQYLSVNKSVLWLVDVGTGKMQPLTDATEEVSWGGAEFLPDGKSLVVTSDRGSEFKRLGFLERATGEVAWMTTEIPWDVEAFDLSPDGRYVVLETNEAGISVLRLLDTSTRTMRLLEGVPVGVIGGILWHPNSAEVAFSISSSEATSDVYTLQLPGGRVERWTESELGGLNAAQLPAAELIRWKSFDDRMISGFLYRAAKTFPGKRPVIINIHGGPEGQSRPGFQGRNNYFMNELGVAMIFPNVRGSVGYGKTWVALDNGFQREDSVKDIGALLDWISEQPDLDAERVMVTGGSYGGYMTLACATRYNDRLRCALDVVGISHFGTFLKNTEAYRRDLRRVEYGDERDPRMASFFEEIAPLNNAGKITKPLFVVQGGNDPRVPLSEAEQIVKRVQQNNSPVWYLMARDEGHGFRRKSNADFQFYATILFIKQYLLGP
jgi:dipeptidyl aminopeptidase/acylaminoacyl peptidase